MDYRHLYTTCVTFNAKGVFFLVFVELISVTRATRLLRVLDDSDVIDGKFDIGSFGNTPQD